MLTATDLRPVRFQTNFKPDTYWVVDHKHPITEADTETRKKIKRTEITWVPFRGHPEAVDTTDKPTVYATPAGDTFVTFHDHQKQLADTDPNRTRNGDEALLGEKVGDILEALVDALKNYPYYVPPF